MLLFVCQCCQEEFEPDDIQQVVCDDCQYAADMSDLDDENGYDPSI